MLKIPVAVLYMWLSERGQDDLHMYSEKWQTLPACFVNTHMCLMFCQI